MENFAAGRSTCPSAIEGDDVIVGDNPSRGTVETSGGRVFFLGIAGMRNRSAEWQVFPAPIHFRCDKNGSCVLTRTNSHVSLQARLHEVNRDECECECAV